MPSTPPIVLFASVSVVLVALAFLNSVKLSMNQVIVVGGGLAGLSAAHSVLEHGGKVILLDKKPA